MNTVALRAPITAVLKNPERQAKVLPAVEVSENIDSQIQRESTTSVISSAPDKGKGRAIEIDTSEPSDIQMDISFDDTTSDQMNILFDGTDNSQIDTMTSQMDMQLYNPPAQMFIAEEQIFVPYHSQTSVSGVLSFGQSVEQQCERGTTKRSCMACKMAKCLHLYHCPGSGKHSLCKCVSEF